MGREKLVRDRIAEYIRNNGGNPIIRIANDVEYWQKLKEKLLEEVGEFEKDESLEEFIDVLEVLDAIAIFKKFRKKEIRRVKMQKAKGKGRFRRRIILDT